jgi:DNA invertase Pin-like site-specific DNA recombinase
MPRLRPVPDAPLRALGLIRVSKERVEMISPELQRTAIEDHCARRGYELVEWVEGIDESGSRIRSSWWARLDQAIERVEHGNAEAIVVWRFDRTARQRLRWAVAIDRVDNAGGVLESATEPVDTSTPSGRLARGMFGEFAAYRAEEIGATWRDVHGRRVRLGLPTDGRARFGYRIVDGVNQPDPLTGPVLESLYRRYVAGTSFYALAAWLNREHVPTGTRAPWSQPRVRRILDSGFAAGLITVHGEQRPGAHPPIIDQALWDTYRAMRVVRRPLKRVERSQYLLSGLVRCGYVHADGSVCGSHMTGGKFQQGRLRMFRCWSKIAYRAHPRGYVAMSTVEGEVMRWLELEAARLDADPRLRAPAVRRLASEAKMLEREILDLDRQLVELTKQLGRRVIPEMAYEAARDEIGAVKRQLEERHARALLREQAPADAGPLARQLLGDWDALLVEERRAILRQLIDRVEVRPVTDAPRGPLDVRVVPVE